MWSGGIWTLVFASAWLVDATSVRQQQAYVHAFLAGSDASLQISFEIVKESLMYKRLAKSPSILTEHSPFNPSAFSSSSPRFGSLSNNMFAKFTAAFTAFTALATLAVATPTPQANSCSTGALQCCESVQSADSLGIAPVLAAIGVILQDINIPIGLTCSPITVVGVGSGNAW